jgi:hypothetical protein
MLHGSVVALILRSGVFAASRRMVRDACKGALLTMRKN